MPVVHKKTKSAEENDKRTKRGAMQEESRGKKPRAHKFHVQPFPVLFLPRSRTRFHIHVKILLSLPLSLIHPSLKLLLPDDFHKEGAEGQATLR